MYIQSAIRCGDGLGGKGCVDAACDALECFLKGASEAAAQALRNLMQARFSWQLATLDQVLRALQRLQLLLQSLHM